ncbi:MAG: Spy/CpxP family protein refolding chaperone [Polyangiaceae bacterium]
MKRTLFSSVVCSLALCLGAVGCSASTASSDPSAGTASAQASVAGSRVAPVAVGAKSSAVRMMANALSTVPLGDDQRAEIEQLATAADARHLAVAAARSQIMLAVAAQVEGGKLDRGALQPQIDASADAMNGARPADEAALQRLHALLTPEQRGAVADAISAHASQPRSAWKDHHHTSHLDQWSADLQLTDTQRVQIAALLAGERAAHGWNGEHGDHSASTHEHGHGFLTSFRSETLTLHAPEDAHVPANAMADHFVEIAQAVLPILTPEQRTLAAAKLRERAAGGAGNEDAPLSE